MNWNLIDSEDPIPDDPIEYYEHILYSVTQQSIEAEEFAVASAYLQGKKDGMRIAAAILIPAMSKSLELEVATAGDKWGGSDVGRLMEADVDVVRLAQRMHNKKGGTK